MKLFQIHCTSKLTLAKLSWEYQELPMKMLGKCQTLSLEVLHTPYNVRLPVILTEKVVSDRNSTCLYDMIAKCVAYLE